MSDDDTRLVLMGYAEQVGALSMGLTLALAHLERDNAYEARHCIDSTLREFLKTDIPSEELRGMLDSAR